jgi:hypothetical protein
MTIPQVANENPTKKGVQTAAQDAESLNTELLENQLHILESQHSQEELVQVLNDPNTSDEKREAYFKHLEKLTNLRSQLIQNKLSRLEQEVAGQKQN